MKVASPSPPLSGSARRSGAGAGARQAKGRKPAADHRAEPRVHDMLAGVRAAGLKLTPQRVAIVRALADDPSHPTAQEIFDRLQASMPTMSFATVYNTLDALSNAGLCGSLSLSPGACRFDPNMTPHHHAVCDGCGLVRDVPAARASDTRGPRDVPGQPPALSGFEVRAVEHIYRGLCASCAARAGQPAEQAGSKRPAPRERRQAPHGSETG
ncbi:MAG: Fur family transcriptional regulator [Polyangiaceae bacterium]